MKRMRSQEIQNNFINCVAFALYNQREMPSSAYVLEKSKQIAKVFGYTGDVHLSLPVVMDKLRVYFKNRSEVCG